MEAILQRIRIDRRNQSIKFSGVNVRKWDAKVKAVIKEKTAAATA
jgi:hypothetical protein